jgi:hypothetical protein
MIVLLRRKLFDEYHSSEHIIDLLNTEKTVPLLKIAQIYKIIIMFSIYTNIKKDSDYRAACGLGLKEFNQLYEVFEGIYETKKELPHGEQKQPILTNKREALFFMLYFLKTGVTFRVLGLTFGISGASAKTYIERIKPYLKKSLETMECMPKSLFETQEDFEKAFANKEDLFIDCTEIPVERADDYEKQKEFYSGKKKHTQ